MKERSLARRARAEGARLRDEDRLARRIAAHVLRLAGGLAPAAEAAGGPPPAPAA